MSRGGSRIRLDDVARLAGVSLSTASRVLSGAGDFSSSVESAVLEASRRLGYSVDPLARALATGTPAQPDAQGGRLVVCVVGPTRSILEDPYVGRAMAAIAETAQGFGAGVSLEWLPLGGRDLRALATASGVRGVILFNTVELVLAGLPRAVAGRVVSVGIGSPEVPRFSVDAAGALEVLRRWPTTDAVFATCDATALGVMSALRRRGVRVPDDVAVAGFDDIPFAAQSAPTLTTATHPVARIASSAALSLLQPAVADSLPRHFGSELVLRESA